MPGKPVQIRRTTSRQDSSAHQKTGTGGPVVNTRPAGRPDRKRCASAHTHTTPQIGGRRAPTPDKRHQENTCGAPHLSHCARPETACAGIGRRSSGLPPITDGQTVADQESARPSGRWRASRWHARTGDVDFMSFTQSAEGDIFKPARIAAPHAGVLSEERAREREINK